MVFLKNLRALIKGFTMLPLVCSYVATASVGRFLLRKDLRKQRLFLARNISHHCRWGLRILGVKVFVQAQDFQFLSEEKRNFFLISNHLSFLDILVLSAVYSSLFITSVEIKNTPFLGLLTDMGGCLYVERRRRIQIQTEVNTIRNTLEGGLNLVLFPEATTGNGEEVLPFKVALLNSVIGTEVPILPVVLNYRKVNHSPINAITKESVFWYGDTPFITVFWRLLGLRCLEVQLDFLSPFSVGAQEDRKILAQKLHKMISNKFTPVV